MLGETAMKTTSIVWSVVFLLCLVAFPVIEYLGGRLCMPLVVPPLFPAQVVPAGVGLLAGFKLMSTVVRLLSARQNRVWALGALTVAVAATGAFWFCSPHLPGFLHGLRDRFIAKVGYARMREFAQEVSQIGKKSSLRDRASGARQRRSSRSSGTIFVPAILFCVGPSGRAL